MMLHALAEKYAVDKLYNHSYIPFYAELLSQMRVRRLLEIGIGYEELMKPFVPRYVHGASLYMWQEALPETEIYACDIRPEVLINDGRIHSMQVDQANADDLDKLLHFAGGSWDLVIDDGSHQTEHQIFTARVLLPTMPPHSVYVIEDVHEPDKIVNALGEGIICQFDKRPDDCLVVMGR